MRTFNSGATRNNNDSKYDYEGFMSPLALVRYGQYMHTHRIQTDGKMRDSDNWQRGIPVLTYMKSLLRHVIDLWLLHRDYSARDGNDGHVISRQEALCAIIFNAFGYLHELEVEKNSE